MNEHLKQSFMFDHDANNKFVMQKGINIDLFFNTILSKASEFPLTVSLIMCVIDTLAFIQRYQALECSYIWRTTGATLKENNDKKTSKM